MQIDTETETEREIETDKDIHRHIYIERHTCRHVERQINTGREG